MTYAAAESFIKAIVTTYQEDDGEACVQIDPPRSGQFLWRACLYVLPSAEEERDSGSGASVAGYGVAIGTGLTLEDAILSLARLRGINVFEFDEVQ